MIVIGLMMAVYALCMLGDMRRISFIYFCFACLNFAAYPVLDIMPASSPMVKYIYIYAISEAVLISTYVLAQSSLKHKLLLLCLLLHILNHAFNDFHYGTIANVIILTEMLYMTWGSRRGIFYSIAEMARALSPRSLRGSFGSLANKRSDRMLP